MSESEEVIELPDDPAGRERLLDPYEQRCAFCGRTNVELPLIGCQLYVYHVAALVPEGTKRKPPQQVSICGRCGAEQASLVSSLLRYEPLAGYLIHHLPGLVPPALKKQVEKHLEAEEGEKPAVGSARRRRR